MSSERVFHAGDRVLLIDARDRRYMIELRSGAQFHSHQGTLDHDSLIGAEPGIAVQTSGGARVVAFRPTLADFVLKMQRGAQVVYPKDLGLIVVYADIFPGATVVEAGTGSGSLTLALARAVGAEGRVISYEVREDHHERGIKNLERWYEGSGSKPENVEARLGNVFEGIPERDVDRLVLDLPEPWRALERAAESLLPGGIFCAYVPTIPQVQQTVEALRSKSYGLLSAFEGLVRTWNVDGQSVRPDHRMVAHTGFIVVGRKRAEAI